MAQLVEWLLLKPENLGSHPVICKFYLLSTDDRQNTIIKRKRGMGNAHFKNEARNSPFKSSEEELGRPT